LIQTRQVDVTLAHGHAQSFSGLLQRGVSVVASTGCSLWTFLTGELGIPPDYVKERITTIFLDGDVVDSLERSVVRDGSLLALSAAMPGLVGATMRRGGYYAAMRAAITHGLESPPPSGAGAVGTVRVKLFNLLIPELGPVLLARGILLEQREVAEALPRGLVAMGDLPAEARVLLRVHFAEEQRGPARA
jgi:hypothetical protein